MKKTLLISCTFLIFNISLNLVQGSVLSCNAQTDTVFNSNAQSDSIFFHPLNPLPTGEAPTLEVTDVPIETLEKEIAIKTKKSTPLDSILPRVHSPKKASWLALIPGAGQIYNKKYWKLPIVYAGLGSTGFLIYYYGNRTSIYRKEYVARANDDIEHLNPDLAIYGDENILYQRDFYRRNMEICVAACVIVYALSILDAAVDAHLFYYDVSDNLALGVKPKINYSPINGTTTPSLALVIKF